MSNTDKIEELLNDGEHHTTYAEAAPQIRALLDENRELWRMLERLEWIDGHHVDFKCPICGEPRYEAGHDKNCQLSALLQRKPKDL